nr:unnamed protein product [Callosobruchus chinensis]
MTDETPFNCASYSIPLIYRDEVKLQISELVEWGIIEKARTDYISPLVVVKKKDGTACICLDARKLNSRIKRDFVNPSDPNDTLYSFTKRQRRCLKGLLAPCEGYVDVYVDDIHVHSDNAAVHSSHLKIISEIFLREGVTVKLRKCQFLCEKICFLGHIVSADGITLND